MSSLPPPPRPEEPERPAPLTGAPLPPPGAPAPPPAAPTAPAVDPSWSSGPGPLPAPAVSPVTSPFAPPGSPAPLASATAAIEPPLTGAEPSAPVWTAAEPSSGAPDPFATSWPATTEPPVTAAAFAAPPSPVPAGPPTASEALLWTTPSSSPVVPAAEWTPAEATPSWFAPAPAGSALSPVVPEATGPQTGATWPTSDTASASDATSTSWWTDPVDPVFPIASPGADATSTSWSDGAGLWTAPAPDPWAESAPAESAAPAPSVDPWAVDDAAPADMWDGVGDDPDAARLEIEALIAKAEADAAAAGSSAPLTFSPPEGVDLRAIVAAEPQEPARPVLDAAGTHGGADSPEWLADLVGSISESPEETVTSTADTASGKDSTFVHFDSRITGAKERMNGFALMSLVASLLWVCGLGSVVGVVFGVVALVQISSIHQRGRIIALIGLSLGVVGAAAAATLFVFDDGGPSETILEDEPDFGEVIVTSCVLDPNGQGVAVVRLVNTRAQPVRYEVTVAFSAAGTRLVNTGSTAILEPKATEMVTLVSEGTLSVPPVCILQDTVLYVEGG